MLTLTVAVDPATHSGAAFDLCWSAGCSFILMLGVPMMVVELGPPASFGSLVCWSPDGPACAMVGISTTLIEVGTAASSGALVCWSASCTVFTIDGISTKLLADLGFFIAADTSILAVNGVPRLSGLFELLK